MANRNSTFLLKRSNVSGKVPTLSGLTIGELALNVADSKLYSLYTGGLTGATEVREIGWDRLSISGGTIFGNILVNGSVSATTFYGDGSQLTGIVASGDNYVTGGTFNSSTNTLYLYRQNGEVVITGFTSSGGVITPSSCNISNTTTNDFEQKLVGSITGFTSGSYIVKSYITTYSGTSKYGFWERTLGVVTSGDTPIVTIVTQDFDDYYSNISLVPTQVSYVPAINNSIEIYVSGVTSENLYWSSYYEILGQNCGSSVSSGSGPFTGNTSGDCISNIFVSNIHSCSPLNINPNNEGNINIGLNNDVVIDLSGNSTKLIVDGSISATTFYGNGQYLTGLAGGSVTGFTYSNNNIILTQTAGSQQSVNISTMTGLTISGLGQNILTVIGSGNSTTAPIFTVQGSSGELFSITDSLVGSLFSVNNISGLPILEVFSNDTTLMGSYLAPSLNTTVRTSLTAGTNFIYAIPISAYTGAFFDYTVISSIGARAGNVMSIWSGSTVQYTDVSTNDIGNTVGVTFSMSVSSGNAILSTSATTSGWTLKTIVRSI